MVKPIRPVCFLLNFFLHIKLSGEDSNLRSPKAPDLQSGPFDHSGTAQKMKSELYYFSGISTDFYKQIKNMNYVARH